MRSGTFDLRLLAVRARILRLPPTPVRQLLRAIDALPVQKPTMLGADTILGWNLDLATQPHTLEALGIAADHPTVDTGIPAVLDAALPYRWRHPVLDRRAA